MLHRLFLMIAIVILFGQGCLPPQRAATPAVPNIETGEPSPEGNVPFYNGFGSISGHIPFFADLPNAALPTVILDATIPPLPPNVTVLREWNRAADNILLRNITTALDIPVGTLGQTSTGQNLLMTWQDPDGHGWEYEAPSHRLTFTRGTRMVTPADALPAPEDATAMVRAFLLERGIDTRGWDTPQAYPSFNEDGVIDGMSVSFASTQDEQTAMIATGYSFPAAEFLLDEKGIREGSVALPTRLDRSNYPAITSGEVLARLRAGGTNPIPQASPTVVVTITDFSMVLYRHLTSDNGTPRVYYLPSIRAEGVIRRGDAQESYATLIPLVQKTAFLEHRP